MAQVQGPGVIRHIWLTFSEAKPNWLAKQGAAAPDEAVLRMYWDGAAEPAVEAPLGDFFAAGVGNRGGGNAGPGMVEGGGSDNRLLARPVSEGAKNTAADESGGPAGARQCQNG